MKKIVSFSILLLNASILNAVFTNSRVVLKIKNKEWVETLNYLVKITPQQREDNEEYFKENCLMAYTFFSLIIDKLKEGKDNFDSVECVPPTKLSCVLKNSQNLNKWLEKQDNGWVLLNFNNFKLSRTMRNRFFNNDEMRQFVDEYYEDVNFEEVIKEQHKLCKEQKALREEQKKQEQEGQVALNLLKKKLDDKKQKDEIALVEHLKNFTLDQG